MSSSVSFSPHAGRRCIFPIWCSFDKTLLRKKLLGDSPKPSSRICLQLRGPRKRSHRQSNGNPFEQTFLRVHTWNTAQGKGCSNSILVQVQIPNHEVRIIPPRSLRSNLLPWLGPRVGVIRALPMSPRAQKRHKRTVAARHHASTLGVQGWGLRRMSGLLEACREA